MQNNLQVEAEAVSFFERTFYGNTVMDWLIAFGIILGIFLIGKVLYWLIKKFVKKLTQRTKTKLDDIIVDMIEEPLVFALTIGGIWFALQRLTFPEWADLWVYRIYYILIIINIAWVITRLIDALIEEYLVPLVEKSEGELDDQLLPIARKGFKIIVWTIAVIVGLNNAGYDVGAIIAGLGIGGLAFALAAQDSISNLFGGFTIFTDKPFTIKDRIKVKGFDGFVEEIGIRSTRLKTLEGRVVTIPNSAFSSEPIENVTSEPSRKVVLNLGLTYDMDDQKIEEAMNILHEITESNNNLLSDRLISFNAFGDFSLNILFIYYIKPEADIFGTQTHMNLEILRKFNAKGLDFAFPSQTIYTKALSQ